jgi:hypothetical protein
MPWQLPSKKNRSAINYLLIVLLFALLAFGIYLFFKFRINAMEKGTSLATIRSHYTLSNTRISS